MSDPAASGFRLLLEQSESLTKAQKFRQLLYSNKLEFLMEAHNGLSARIVEQTGFKGIWASSLSMSAALGVRDNNEASWTQILEVCEFMGDATTVPILLDGDTGYGNFNNVRRLVRKLEQREIAAVCIEDKLFPKKNSFLDGERQPLADIGEFVGKIKAAKDEQRSDAFCVVARIEAFIAGWGLDEVLRRAEAYHTAGADALLIHSKLTGPGQILAFARAWAGKCPIIIVPTTYYSTPTEQFASAGISMAVWANHNVRSCIKAMQSTCKQIFVERSLRTVEDQIAPVKEVFRLQNAGELSAAEERYLPTQHHAVRAIILAAARGESLNELAQDKPKAMVNVAGRPLLQRLTTQFRQEGVRNITVVRGFGKQYVHVDGVEFADNDEFAATGELFSLDKAWDSLQGEVVFAFGDIIFRKYVLQMLLDAQEDIVIAVDSSWRHRPSFNGKEDFVSIKSLATQYGAEKHYALQEMNPTLDERLIDGEWIGMMRTTFAGTQALRAAIGDLRCRENFRSLQMFHLLNHLVQMEYRVTVRLIDGNWLDLDNLRDLAEAERFNF